MSQTVQLVLPEALEVGKCYTLTFDSTGHDTYPIFFTFNVTDNYTFYLTNPDGSHYVNMDITSVGVDTVSDEGTLSVAITDPITSIWVHVGSGEISNLELRLDPDCVTTYCSECFDLQDCETGVLLQWFNDESGFGFNYSDMPFIQSMRVEGGIRIPTSDYLDETYYMTSGGEKGMIFNQVWMSRELWIHELPEYLHNAISVGIAHDHFFIDGVEYVKAEGGYAPDWNVPETLLAPVIVKIQEKTQNLFNDNC